MYELMYGAATLTEAIPGHDGCEVVARRMKRAARNRYDRLRQRAFGYQGFDELPPTQERVQWAGTLREAAETLATIGAEAPPTKALATIGAEAPPTKALATIGAEAPPTGELQAQRLEAIAEALERGGRMGVVDPEALQESIDHLLHESIAAGRFPAEDGKQRLWSPDDRAYNVGLLEMVPPALEGWLTVLAMRANGLLAEQQRRESEALGNSGASPEPTGEATPEPSSE